jgi:hypothetical protein
MTGCSSIKKSVRFLEVGIIVRVNVGFNLRIDAAVYFGLKIWTGGL